MTRPGIETQSAEKSDYVENISFFIILIILDLEFRTLMNTLSNPSLYVFLKGFSFN